MPGLNLNGILPVQSLSQLLADRTNEASLRQHTPLMQSLAAYVRKCWDAAYRAKMQVVDQRLLANLRQRRGEYEPAMKADISQQGGSEIFMMITSNKCRAASAWLRDTLMGAKDEKPWTIMPTPIPDLPPDLKQAVFDETNQRVMEIEQLEGRVISYQEAYELVQQVKSQRMVEMREMAKEAAGRMEDAMEDQMLQGEWRETFSAFLDDLVTFPAALLKGPVLRKKPKLVWQDAGGKFEPVVTEEVTATWSRLDPFNAYPAPGSTHPNDGFFIERHRLSRQALTELQGVDGYDDDAIAAVLDEYGRGGLRDWLYIDSAKAQAEGKSISAVMDNIEGDIDALQFWGAVQGRALSEWGMDDTELDPVKEYHCEVWLVGRWVIKAILNYDPFYRKPYFKASFEEVPGSFWGNGVPDLMRDCQSMCNYAARSIADNMGLAAGPQIAINTDRLAAGEDLTEMFPRKIWQMVSDPMGSTAPPISFFQPTSISGELIAIFDKFASRADEDTGIPKYITGDNAGIGGAGRTASGMSMLMGNAGKTIKQVIFNVDTHVIQPAVERLYVHNMMYSDDPDLKGDIAIVAVGAEGLVVKDAAQTRRSEFLQTVFGSPMAQQIVGVKGVAALLHEQAKTLDMDADEIVPDEETLMLQQVEQQAQMAQQAAQAPTPVQAQSGQDQGGAQDGARRRAVQPSGQALMTGEPITDTMGAPA